MGTRSPARCAMIRLAISAEAFEAIVATLPLGSVRPPHDFPRRCPAPCLIRRNARAVARYATA